MPSPAALAKCFMAFMITPLTQEAINTPLDQKAISTPLHEGGGDNLVYGNRNTPLNTGGVQVAGNSGIYICVHGGFTGYCRYFSSPFGQCTNLDGDLAHKVSAAGPDKGTWCTLYAGWGCTGAEYNLYWPGESHLGNHGFGDRAVSFNCATE